MCADKLRDTSPISIRFAEGEIADPTKVDGVALQADRSVAILEHAIGDLWNSGGDAFIQAAGLISYALMIPNLARYLGVAALLNPRLFNTSSVTEYTHKVLTADVGAHEFQLSLPPTGATSFTWAGTSTPTGSPETNLSDVNASGEWYVDRTTGYVFTYEPVQSDWTLTYAPTVASEMGDDAEANIIPDPNTHTSYAFQGCKIAYANNTDNSQGYIIYLPPRGPLSSSRRTDRSPQSAYDATANTDNESATPDSTPVKLWQSSTVDATTGSYAEHYRYKLPELITDNWSSGDALPLGLLHLWDPTETGTTIDGLSFSAESAASPRKYVLIVSGTAIDSWVSSYIDTVYAGCGGSACLTNRDNHAPAYYPAGGLRVVTVGNAVSDAISKLSKALLEHDHASANSQPGKQVPHSSLSGLFHPTQGGDAEIVPSMLENDDHPQYLHRMGANPATQRDQYYNGMFGDLLMLSTDSASHYLNNSANSQALVFGSSSGPRMYYNNVDGGIALEYCNTLSVRDATMTNTMQMLPYVSPQWFISSGDLAIYAQGGTTQLHNNNLLMASNYTESLSVDSFALQFGSSSGPQLHYDQVKDALVVENKDVFIEDGAITHTPGIYTIACNINSPQPASNPWTWEMDATGVPYWKAPTAGGTLVLEIDDWPEGAVIWYIDTWCWPRWFAGDTVPILTISCYIKEWNTNPASGSTSKTAMTSIGTPVTTSRTEADVLRFTPNITYLSHVWTHGQADMGSNSVEGTSRAGEKIIMTIGAPAKATPAEVYGVMLWVISPSVCKWAR